MIRNLIYLVVVGAAVAVAVWLADRPGSVVLEWQGWQLETSLGIAALAVVVVAVVAGLLWVSWSWLVRRPHEWGLRRQLKRQRAGMEALADGLVAIAAGDSDAAARHGRRAGALLEHAPMTLLLEAQTAQIAGDDEAARRAFEKMLEAPETEFLGLRGLITDAMRAGDDGRALAHARRAYALKPRTPWVLDTMIALHSRAGEWREAQRLVEESQKSRRSSGTAGRRQQAALLTERARTARGAGNAAEAYAQARKAAELDPALAPANELVARLVADDGRTRRARKMLEKAWAECPHPALVAAYLDIAVGAADPLDRYKAVEMLVRPAREHSESRFAVAEAALDAGLWGEARKQLGTLVETTATPRVFRLMARLADEDAEDESRAEDWLERAAQADADSAWVCGDCGTVADDWSAVCGHCGAFATLDWTQPPRVHRAVVAPAADRDPQVSGDA
jgi:HemY protein